MTGAVNAPAPGAAPRRTVDGVLLSATGLLVALGVLATYTASYRLGDAFWHEGAFFLKRQLLWALVGGCAFCATLAFDYRTWRRYSVPIIAGTLVVLLAMLVAGASRFGGQRWVTGGGSIQPSEIAKLAIVVYIADWLSSKRDDIRNVQLGLIPFGIIMGVLCGLIVLQNHLSTAALIGAVAVTMFFTAGAEIRQMAASAAVAATVLWLLIWRMPYRWQRVLTFMDPSSDPTGAGYQVLRTLDAIMRGGVLGVGLGNGQQKHLIPAPHTDAAFAVLGEETGLVGCLLVVGLFALFAWRGFRVAAGSTDRFASLLALGITCWIAFQALVNIAVVTAFMPFTGVPMPFVSYGGSSLVACLAASGILLNLSRQVDPTRTGANAFMGLWRRHGRSRLSRDHRARSRDW